MARLEFKTNATNLNTSKNEIRNDFQCRKIFKKFEKLWSKISENLKKSGEIKRNFEIILD